MSSFITKCCGKVVGVKRYSTQNMKDNLLIFYCSHCGELFDGNGIKLVPDPDGKSMFTEIPDKK